MKVSKGNILYRYRYIMQQAFEFHNRNIADTWQPMKGVVSPESILIGQNARVDELNTRILDRFQSDAPLQSNIDFRPVPTKYATFPIIDRRKPVFEHIDTPLMEYTPEAFFAPIGTNGPSDFFRQSVDTESRLRNQFFAMQRGSDYGVYVPNSNSEMYGVRMPTCSRVEPQPHTNLFEPMMLYTVSRNENPLVGRDRFNNHTRFQLRASDIQAADPAFQL